jgi:DNA-directed RNA polymerase subunit K/omega
MAAEAKEEYFEGVTKFEKARIIGARALQISMGAPFLIKVSEKELENVNFNPIEIAKLEYEKDLIPLSIKRPYPKAK